MEEGFSAGGSEKKDSSHVAVAVSSGNQYKPVISEIRDETKFGVGTWDLPT